MSSKTEQSNNLNELNSILFETLRGVVKKEIDPKEAQTVVNVASAITNNAKVQLSAFKMTGGAAPVEAIGYDDGQVEKYKKIRMSRSDAALAYAKEHGYKNVASAIGAMGSTEFNRGVDRYLNQEK
ncbi:hypothetical protein Q4603_05765 [Zobellia galactanivorans]|uniref:hypothetical protein n=1 Tax=Zobellia galactanivorans (strain DSM 12802 / CCUG 47099 / CIP 106680 / NCIMB 13871 / Dsij) TaxID=63186 RepID=UPI0026E13620|nr:hypothetical protein [Zobellia galactanivorans]MDO6808102.1 hypothetical protein [Zobellia galactanivorans]